MVDAFVAAGYHVTAIDLDAERLKLLEGTADVSAVVLDVTERSELTAAIDEVVRLHGRLDVLCNNAGIPDRFEGVTECEDMVWDRVLSVNLTAAFVASRAAAAAMLQAGRGVILNTASVAGLRGGEAGVAYTVSKHGLIGLTRSIAAMYGDEGVRCVAICPGPVATGMAEINAARRSAGRLSSRGQAMALKTAPLRGRRAEPREVAQLAVFLASDACALLNGCCVEAESGRLAQ